MLVALLSVHWAKESNAPEPDVEKVTVPVGAEAAPLADESVTVAAQLVDALTFSVDGEHETEVVVVRLFTVTEVGAAAL